MASGKFSWGPIFADGHSSKFRDLILWMRASMPTIHCTIVLISQVQFLQIAAHLRNFDPMKISRYMVLEELLCKCCLAPVWFENTGKTPLASLRFLGMLAKSVNSKWTPPTNFRIATAMSERVAYLWLCVPNHRYLDIGASARLLSELLYRSTSLSPYFLCPWIQPNLASSSKLWILQVSMRFFTSVYGK